MKQDKICQCGDNEIDHIDKQCVSPGCLCNKFVKETPDYGFDGGYDDITQNIDLK